MVFLKIIWLLNNKEECEVLKNLGCLEDIAEFEWFLKIHSVW